MTAGGSTKARILSGALQLFNEEGYAGQSAVDVAHALSISPGHLYYHFKGKAEIAAALLESHIEELEAIVAAARRDLAGADVSLETLWTHVHIFMEEIHDARFAWREGRYLWASDRRLGELIRRGAALAEQLAHDGLDRLRSAGAIRLGEEARDGFAAQMALGLCLQGTWLDMAAPDAGSARAQVARAAALVMLPPTALAPPPAG